MAKRKSKKSLKGVKIYEDGGFELYDCTDSFGRMWLDIRGIGCEWSLSYGGGSDMSAMIHRMVDDDTMHPYLNMFISEVYLVTNMFPDMEMFGSVIESVNKYYERHPRVENDLDDLELSEFMYAEHARKDIDEMSKLVDGAQAEGEIAKAIKEADNEFAVGDGADNALNEPSNGAETPSGATAE